MSATITVSKTTLLEPSTRKTILLHVAKTGGTSLANMLFEAFEPGEIINDFPGCRTNVLGHFLNDDIAAFLREMPGNQFARCKLLSAHLSVGLESCLPDVASYVSVFRNPVSRMLSGFLYGTHGTENLSEDFLWFGLHRSVSLATSPGFDNPLTRILAGSEYPELLAAPSPNQSPACVTLKHRESALRVLSQHFGFVGLTERFGDTAYILWSLLGKGLPPEQLRLNETSAKLDVDRIPLATLRLLEHHLDHDIAIYAAGCEIFNNHARRHDIPPASPYLRRTIQGAITSGDHAHVVSAEEAFNPAPDSLWLSCPGNPNIEFIGFEFSNSRSVHEIEIQIVRPLDYEILPFALEASDDNFCLDCRHVADIKVPADGQLHFLTLPDHEISAKTWRLNRLNAAGGMVRLAIAHLAFERSPNAKPKDIATLDIKIRHVTDTYNERNYVDRLAGIKPSMPDTSLSPPPADIETKTPGIATPLSETPSIFFVSLPKSGTVYTWYSLRDMTGLKIPDFHEMEGWREYNSGRDFSCPELYACGDYNTQLLIPKGMRGFLKGYIFGSHMQASHHNMRILKECGIDRISVLLRDPRDAFVSWVHHLNKLGPSARNYHSKIYHIPRQYYDWTLAEQFAYQIRSFLPITINWVEGWLDYYASENKPVDVLFVFYDELKRNPKRYIRRITEFHGIKDVDFSKVVIPEPGKMHFRKGEHEQWRIEFTNADIELAENLLGSRILQGFNAAANQHPGMISAKAELERNEVATAALAAFTVVQQFSNFRQGYEVLLDLAERVGVDCTLLRTKLEESLSNTSIANCFIYHQELVDTSLVIVKDIQNKV